MNQPHAVAHAEEMAEWKNFSRPDEVREFPRGRVELIKIGGATVGRAIFEPGWRWSTSVQPIAKTRQLRRAALSVSRRRRAARQDGRWNRVRLSAGRCFAAAFRARRVGSRR